MAPAKVIKNAIIFFVSIASLKKNTASREVKSGSIAIIALVSVIGILDRE